VRAAGHAIHFQKGHVTPLNSLKKKKKKERETFFHIFVILLFISLPATDVTSFLFRISQGKTFLFLNFFYNKNALTVQVSTAAGVRGTMKPQIYTLLPAAAVQKQHSNIIN